MVAKPIFIGGTSSHAGKSWMATAICRHLHRRGLRVAPFKAQNMSNNSYPCAGGGEIGRAQVVQAEACELEPTSDMNPILLKPNSETGSQVVLNGKVWRNLRAREYYDHHQFLREQVLAAYERLARDHEYIVIEGAGSVAEINLRRTDLVNLPLARAVGAPALLVADIDRGGVFAAVAGSISLLDAEEAALVRSFAINRFRGDVLLFAGGVAFLEAKTQRPCLGVFPFEPDILIDPEDGVSLDRPGGGGDVAVLRFPHVSNFTDLRLLPDAHWISACVDKDFRCVILPGTKNTIHDLGWMRARGLDDWLDRQRCRGAMVVGVCGGYQMLGLSIEDPQGVESEAARVDGLRHLPVRTVMTERKTTKRVRAVTPGGVAFDAYEIHMGITERPAGSEPAFLPDEGIRAEGIIGTYLHGALEHAAVLSELLGRPVCAAPPKRVCYDALADWFERNANLDLFAELYL
jgi:adenosylcobyric acid synthase